MNVCVNKFKLYYLLNDSLNDDDDIVNVVTEYFNWIAINDNDLNGNVYKSLLTCSIDASKFFGNDYKNIVKKFNLENDITKAYNLIASYIQDINNNVDRTIPEACAIVGILAEAIKYYKNNNLYIVNKVITLINKFINTPLSWLYIKIALNCRINRM
ncbi:hypothetical protein [Hypsugopox virus]|nr:hypothetical protein [Hypsugopox virus]